MFKKFFSLGAVTLNIMSLFLTTFDIMIQSIATLSIATLCIIAILLYSA
jgi:hypothetical protein